MSRIEQQMRFILEVDRMKTIIRRSYISDGSRRENDAEHSWHLAIMAMTLSEYFDGVDPLCMIKMVLIHDLVELHAGDTFLYDDKGNDDKALREQEAADRIFPLLPDDQAAQFRALWEEFEERATADAKAAAVLDRMQPLMLNIAVDGKTWKEHGVRLGQVEAAHSEAMKNAPPEILAYIHSLLQQAKDEHMLEP